MAKKSRKSSSPTPKNPALYARVKQAAKKKFRDNNPGGNVSKSTYQQSVKDGTSSQY